jgi:hypothetical protein
MTTCNKKSPGTSPGFFQPVAQEYFGAGTSVKSIVHLGL